MGDRVPSSPGGVPRWLLGRWKLLRAAAPLDFVPGTSMEFLPRGELRYTIPTAHGGQVIPLLYRVEGDELRTDNVAAPHARSTHFRCGPGGMLVLDFAGAEAVFVRLID
jgi:hypothetical protein